MASAEMSPEEQQDKWLSEGKAVAKQQAFLMKRALDSGSLRDGLKVTPSLPSLPANPQAPLSPPLTISFLPCCSICPATPPPPNQAAAARRWQMLHRQCSPTICHFIFLASQDPSPPLKLHQAPLPPPMGQHGTHDAMPRHQHDMTCR